MIAAVVPVFEADPRWVVYLLFVLSLAAALRGIWLLLSELFWEVYDWCWWRWRE